MLVALANAQVMAHSTVTVQTNNLSPTTDTDSQGDDLFARWQQTLLAGGYQPPDQHQAPALGGTLAVAGLYRSTRTAVVLTTPSQAQVAALLDKGYTVVDMSEPCPMEHVV